MASKKGQLFLVSVVFLIVMIFVIQQSLFSYGYIDPSEAYDSRVVDILADLIEEVNLTIRNADVCSGTKDSFEENMRDMKSSLLQEFGRAYSIEMIYELNCSFWPNPPPQDPPLFMTLSVTGPGKDARATYGFYHVH